MDIIFQSPWTWYIVRASGLVGAGLLVLIMLTGIGQVTGLIYKFIEPLKIWVVHKTLAIALCAAIVVHVLFLLIDRHVSFSVVQVFVPFASTYNNHVPVLGLAIGGIAVALGVLAMYGVLLIVLSSLGWIDTKKGAWRKLHYLSYFVILAIFIHALGAGTDLKHGLLRTGWLVVSGVLLLGIVMRLRRAGTLRDPDQ